MRIRAGFHLRASDQAEGWEQQQQTAPRQGHPRYSVDGLAPVPVMFPGGESRDVVVNRGLEESARPQFREVVDMEAISGLITTTSRKSLLPRSIRGAISTTSRMSSTG